MKSTQTKIVDFTKEAPNTHVNGRTIRVCDRCGKPGLAESLFEKTVILHTVWLIDNYDGTIQTRDDICVIPVPTPAKSSKSTQQTGK